MSKLAALIMVREVAGGNEETQLDSILRVDGSSLHFCSPLSSWAFKWVRYVVGRFAGTGIFRSWEQR